MTEEITQEDIQEEKVYQVAKFTRPGVIEELTEQNVKDIIESQQQEIINLNNEIVQKQSCIAHYQAILDVNKE